MSIFHQKSLQLPGNSQGYQLITDQIENALPEIREIRIGFLQVFLQHTSAGLSINENSDPTVRKDFQTFVNELIPETYPRFVHDYEGADDMPAHIKSAFFGISIQILISGGKLALGIWQGIYLCEFRNQGGRRNLVLTAMGTI